MDSLLFPAYPFRLRATPGGQQIWDQWRNRWVALTPEEWVRQHLASYLVQEMGFPSGRMHLEASLSVNGLRRRADLVVYGPAGSPLFLAEVKAPDVPLSGSTADQVAVYNQVFGVSYVLLTNGRRIMCGRLLSSPDAWEWLPAIPRYEEL